MDQWVKQARSLMEVMQTHFYKIIYYRDNVQ